MLDRDWNAHKLERVIVSAMTTVARPAKSDAERYMPLTLENLFGKIRGDFNQPIIVEQYVGPDDRNSSHNIIQFDQTSLGLPSREYFLKEGANKEKDAYFELMVDIAELLGAERAYAVEQMANVLEFETKLANVTFFSKGSILWLSSFCFRSLCPKLTVTTLALYTTRKPSRT